MIVIDDGSVDNTGKIAKRYPVRYIRNKINKGKGYSMDKAVKLAEGDIIFFCDADIQGLTHQIIKELTTPILNGEAEMMIAMRNRKIYYLKYILTFVPLLGGERALTKKLWIMIPPYFKDRFKIEAGLNFYSKYYGKGFNYKVFQNLSQTIKEKKYGIIEGIKQRAGMFKDIISAQLRLELKDIPRNVKNKREIFMNLIIEIVGTVFGLLLTKIIKNNLRVNRDTEI